MEGQGKTDKWENEMVEHNNNNNNNRCIYRYEYK